jgi:putative transposase
VTTQTYRRARHSVSLLPAHLVFVTKYRRAVFTDAMLTFCEHTMPAVGDQLDVELVEANGQADHAHLLVAYSPTPAICVLAPRLKGRTAYPVRREFTGVNVRARMRGHPWSPSYVAVSCPGAPPSIIKQYIDRQARPLRTPGYTRRYTRWAHPGLKSKGLRPRTPSKVSIARARRRTVRPFVRQG